MSQSGSCVALLWRKGDSLICLSSTGDISRKLIEELGPAAFRSNLFWFTSLMRVHEELWVQFPFDTEVEGLSIWGGPKPRVDLLLQESSITRNLQYSRGRLGLSP